jgi:hypothetical protein
MATSGADRPRCADAAMSRVFLALSVATPPKMLSGISRWSTWSTWTCLDSGWGSCFLRSGQSSGEISCVWGSV